MSNGAADSTQLQSNDQDIFYGKLQSNSKIWMEMQIAKESHNNDQCEMVYLSSY